jgi:hypothetical protein
MKLHAPERMEKVGGKMFTDINDVTWPSGASLLVTNQVTSDGKLKDLSGNGNHGTINGATPIDGPWGKCWYFDGIDDVINFGDVCNDVFGVTDFSLVAIFNTVYYNDLQGIITKRNSLYYSAATCGLYVYNNAAKIANFIIGTGNENETSDAIDQACNPNTFNVFVGSADATHLHSYFNDSNASIVRTKFPIPTTDDLLVGAFCNGARFFKGSIAAIALYPRCLLSDESASIYSQLFGSWS